MVEEEVEDKVMADIAEDLGVEGITFKEVQQKCSQVSYEEPIHDLDRCHY